MNEKTRIGAWKENRRFVDEYFHTERNVDAIVRDFRSLDGRACFLVYIDGMADSEQVNDFIMRPIMTHRCAGLTGVDQAVEFGDCTLVSDMETACQRVLQGDTAVFMEALDTCGVCETKGFDKRSVSTPETENVVKGSHEGFNESIRSNITLLRRSVKSGDLITEMVTIGNVSGEKCAVLYLDGITDPQTVAEVKRRLHGIQGDYYSGSGMIEQMIEDSRFSLFPSVLTTERPERAAQYLAAGRTLIICDNTPYALVVPITASELFDSPEGNQQRWQNGTFAKWIRVFAFLCSTVLSGLYIALLNFHREMLPSQLLKVIAESRAEIPFTALAELLVMEVFFELVREAGIRIPNAVGGAVSVVSGLILGQAAVEARIVSPVTLIIVAITGIANAAIPDYDLSVGIRITKFALILLGGLFGLAGLTVGVVLLALALCSQRSFGIDMAQSSDLRAASTGIWIQTPIWMQELRTKYLNTLRRRQQPDYSRSWDQKGKKS